MVAILTGDFLLAQSSIIAADLGTDVARLLGETNAELTDGPGPRAAGHRQLRPHRRGLLRRDQRQDGCTAACACRIGAITGGLDQPTTDALAEFGHSYGMAFQIVDDILDVVATSEQLGKPAGNDILEGNFTLPVLRALRSENGDQLRSLIEAGLTPETRDQALVMVRTSPGIADALDAARSWADKAAGAISNLPDSPGATALRAASIHLVERARSPLG